VDGLGGQRPIQECGVALQDAGASVPIDQAGRPSVARAIFGEGAAAAAWAEARTAELLARGPEPVRAALRAAEAPPAAGRAALRAERGDFARNAERMTYPEFRLDGLPIASGAIESAADHLVRRRMKRAGMRWSDAGGDAMLALRARLRSGRPLTRAKPA
jgi:hypothetical protein